MWFSWTRRALSRLCFPVNWSRLGACSQVKMPVDGAAGSKKGNAGEDLAMSPEAIPQTQNADREMWEHHIETTIESDSQIPDTDRKALIVAGRGQGLFKQRVMQIEKGCRVTGVNNSVDLVGSHCKPWRDPSNESALMEKWTFADPDDRPPV
jgi:hypothetical protein